MSADNWAQHILIPEEVYQGLRKESEPGHQRVVTLTTTPIYGKEMLGEVIGQNLTENVGPNHTITRLETRLTPMDLLYPDDKRLYCYIIDTLTAQTTSIDTVFTGPWQELILENYIGLIAWTKVFEAVKHISPQDSKITTEFIQTIGRRVTKSNPNTTHFVMTFSPEEVLNSSHLQPLTPQDALVNRVELFNSELMKVAEEASQKHGNIVIIGKNKTS